MDDDIDDMDNISELKLLESLDLGHRKVFKEETKQKENDEFVENINLLLSKLNERINIMKNLPKLEIKPFDIESIKSNESNKPKDKNQNPKSQNVANNNLNYNLSNISNTNNLVNNTYNTPYPVEDSLNFKHKKMKYVIPDSFNEKTNNRFNQINNNNINNIKINNNEARNNNNNIRKNIPGEDYIEVESNQSIESLGDNNNNNNNHGISEKGNIDKKSEINVNNNSEDGKNKEDLLGKTKNENINNNIPNNDNNNINNPEIEINKSNIEDIVSNSDDIQEISEDINKLPEANNKNPKQSSSNKEVIESFNYLNSKVKNEEDDELNVSKKNKDRGTENKVTMKSKIKTKILKLRLKK